MKEHAESEQDDHIRLYLREIGQYKLLSKEDEVELSKKIEQGTKARRILEQLLLLESDLEKLRQRQAADENTPASKKSQAATLAELSERIAEQTEAVQELRNDRQFKRLGSGSSSSLNKKQPKGSRRANDATEDDSAADAAKPAKKKAKGKPSLAQLERELAGIHKHLTLLKRLDKECQEAETQFINSNLRLVVSIAKKYQASKLPLLDLIQEGNLGLIHAVSKFEWQKGFKFSTYATWWIRQAITRGIANTSRTIRLPIHAVDVIARLQKARSTIESAHGRPASLEELADELNMEQTKVSEALQFAGDPISLSDPLRENNDTKIGDMVEDTSVEAPDVAASKAMMPKETEKMLSTLTEREQEILAMRFGIKTGQPKTLEEVGEAMSLTRERVRQIESRAMSKLRHPSSDLSTRDIFPY